VQDLGRTGRRYPLRIILSGENYDLDAEAWMQALGEAGEGKLEHPVYGTVTVVPTGTIRRRDDLVSQANQALIEVTFFETTGTIYPTSQSDPGGQVINSISDYNDAAAEQFEEKTELDNAVDQASFQAQYQALLDEATQGLEVIAEQQQNVQDQFSAITESISRGLTVLIEQPLTLAYQTTQLIQAPARAVSAISDRLAAYGNLLDLIVSGADSVATTTGRDSRNLFAGRDLYASTYVTGSVLSAVNSQFDTKDEAISAAAEILEQFDRLNEWRDSNYEVLTAIDTGEAYQRLINAVGLAAGFLVEISFTLKQERRFVLTRNRTMIDLCAELYGSVDDQLDFFINSNLLTGDEILEVPAGREVVYYV
jgi:prophage DNA circulation protein